MGHSLHMRGRGGGRSSHVYGVQAKFISVLGFGFWRNFLSLCRSSCKKITINNFSNLLEKLGIRILKLYRVFVTITVLAYTVCFVHPI
jgi:hypothetical protein